MPPKKFYGTTSAQPVTCPECGVHAERKIAGPTAQKPDTPYWICPLCTNNQGKKGKFLRWDDPVFSPKKDVPYPKKRKNWETSTSESNNEQLNSKIDKLLGMMEEIYSMLQTSDSPPGSPPEEASS